MSDGRGRCRGCDDGREAADDSADIVTLCRRHDGTAAAVPMIANTAVATKPCK